MNKILLDKVKAKCKDTGLSEKYLKAITEKMGGSIEDDSTDDVAIDSMANQIAELAVETQGEATRWAAKKEPKEPKDPKEVKEPKEPTDPPVDDKDARIKALEEKLSKMEVDDAKSAREKAIHTALDKHKIPAEFRDRLARSISDDEDLEETVAGFKQTFITAGLVPGEAEGTRVASEKQIDEMASSLLETIKVK